MSTPIPSIDDCLNYMEEFAMYENIRRHSFMVARVADIILQGLQSASSVTTPPSRALVVAGALMHDIAKTQCIQEGCKHAEVGREICRELGLETIGEIVANHVVLSRFDQNAYKNGHFSAIELVFYADKRVKHDQVVPLSERLDYIIDKYSNNEAIKEEYIRKNFEQCQKVEQYLFSRLDFSPHDIMSFLPDSSSDLLHFPPEN